MQLGEITEPKIDQSGPPLTGDFTYVDIGSVDNGAKRIVEPKVMPVANAPSRARQRLRTGDVLVSMTRPNLNAVALVPPELDGAIGSTGFHVLRASQRVLPKWLYYAVQTRQFVGEMSDLVQGALYPAVRPKDIRAFDLPVPMLDEQRRIVAEIEKQFSRLDEAVANLKRVKANLKRYKAAVLKAAVDGRLVPTEAELARREGRGYENAAQLLGRVLEGRRRQAKGRYKEPDTQDTGALPALPEGWVWASAEQCCASVRDGTHDTPAYVTSGIPLVTSKNLLDDGIDFDNTKHISVADHHEISRRSAVARGDVLFAMIGTVGNPTKVKTERPFSIKNVGLFKGDDDCLSAAYLCHWLSSPVLCAWLRPRLKGTTQKFAPLGLLRELPIALPPRSEQDRIVAEVDRQLSTVAAFERSASAEIGSAQLRRAILHEVFRLSRGSGSPRSAECS
jgi:type I restriction enzyme S subunit